MMLGEPQDGFPPGNSSPLVLAEISSAGLQEGIQNIFQSVFFGIFKMENYAFPQISCKSKH